MPLVPQDVRGVSTRAMSEAQRVREEGAAAQTSDAEAKPVQVDLLLQLQQMMAEQARRQEEQARRQEEQARRQEEQARCQAEQLRELKEEQARRQEEQARRQEEQARCQAEQLRELKEDQARRQEDQARRQEEQARRLEEMHRDFTKGLQKAVERVQEVEEGLGKLKLRVMAIEERLEEEISKIKQEVTNPSPLKSRSRLAAVFDAPNAALSATKGLKIPHYDGTTSWTAFKLQFETLMEAYGWTQKEAQSALTLALRDQALSVLEAIGASGDLSFSALLDALEARFGDSHLEHVYRAQLKERTQRANESLQQWSVEIEKLVRRAFRSTPSMIEGTLLQAFIDGIRDPEVRAAVHLGHHKIMKEALAHALEVEAVRSNSRTLRLREMPTTEQVPPRRRNFMCYGCGERGHIRSDCPKKMNRKDAAVSTSDQQGNLNPARAAGWAPAGSGTTPTIYIKQTNDGNTLVIDGQASQTSQVFDIMEQSKPESGCVIHIPAVGGVGLQPAGDCRMYSDTWVVFQPDYIIDARLGCLWRVHLIPAGLAHSVPKDEISKIVAVLLRRTDGKDTIFRILNQLVSEADSYLVQISEVFDEIHTVYSARGAGAGARVVVSQGELCQHVLQQHGGAAQLVRVVSAYVASLARAGLAVQQPAAELAVRALVTRGAAPRLRALLRRAALTDARPLACALLSLGHLDPAAAQLALDMLWRLKGYEEVVEVLLSWDEPVAALGAARQAGLGALPPRKLLAAARAHAQAQGRPTAFTAIYHALQARNERTRGSPHFLKGEQCDSYVEYYKQITAEPQ
ncbi:unnamed protein product [Spodoptera exigua]|nr:unnamed protein product [Spodoptera exigua]